MSTRYWLSIGILLFALGAEAASFDCAKATTSVEKLICSHSGLSDLDERLADAYREALAETKDENSLRQSQRKWLASVRNRCKDLDCLVVAYVDRLVELTRPEAKAEEGLGAIAEREWEVFDLFLFDMPFCREFFRTLEQSPEEIEVVPPLVVTDDWSDPRMQAHLEGCDKRDFAVSEKQNRQKLDEGVYHDWPSGEVYRAIDRFALWKLPFDNSGKGEYLLYTGPIYRWKSTYDEKAVGKFIYGGTFDWVSQPGCQRVISFVEHGAFEGEPARSRESRVLIYRGSLYLFKVGALGGGPPSRISGSLEKLQAGGKAKSMCSALERREQEKSGLPEGGPDET